MRVFNIEDSGGGITHNIKAYRVEITEDEIAVFFNDADLICAIYKDYSCIYEVSNGVDECLVTQKIV